MNKIKILGKIFSLTRCKFGDKELISENSNVLAMGKINTTAQWIKIQSGLPKETEFEILLHECVHGISDAFRIDLTEHQVECLGEGLLALFKDNPKILELLK